MPTSRSRYSLGMSLPTQLIHVNGAPLAVAADTTVQGLLEQLNMAGKRVAVERNQEIVPRSQHASCQLAAGDRLELVHAIGGG